jgi:hypothetical protein
VHYDILHPVGATRHLEAFVTLVDVSLVFILSMVFFLSVFLGNNKQSSGECFAVATPQWRHACVVTKYYLPEFCIFTWHAMPAVFRA